MDLKKNFEQLYLRENITRYGLSKKTGISAENIKKIEDSISNPHVSTLERLAEGLGCSLSDLFAESLDTNVLSENDLSLLKQLKSLPSDQQALITGLIKEFQKSLNENQGL